MTGAVRSRTPQLNLAVLRYNFPNWGDDLNKNMQVIDAAFAAFGIAITGAWENSTIYYPGSIVADTTTNELFRSNELHTSAATGTFVEDRALRPTIWSAFSVDIIGVNEWEAGVAYFRNNVTFLGHVWVIATRQFISRNTLADDIAAGDFVVITDLTETVNVTENAKDVAVTSASNAANSASASSTSAANSLASASASETSATASQVSRVASETARDASINARDAAVASANAAAASQTAANNSETAAATSASNALASQNAASSSAAAASTSEGNAANSASAAADSQVAAASSELNASNDAASALSSKNAAAISESNAAGSASAAAAAEANASNSATNASNSAGNAANSAVAAATSATDAANSATAAADSAASIDVNNHVRYDVAQSNNAARKAQARSNLDAMSPYRQERAGSANALAIIGEADLAIGMQIRFRAATINTGAVTITYNGGTAIACRTITGAVLPAGYIRNDVDTEAIYNGTNWIVDRQIEHGSNANGEYVRWADGTQFAWHVLGAQTVEFTEPVGQGMTRTCVYWTFPVHFISAPAASAGVGLGNRILGVATDSVEYQATIGLVRFVTTVDPTDVSAAMASAIGRWY